MFSSLLIYNPCSYRCPDKFQPRPVRFPKPDRSLAGTKLFWITIDVHKNNFIYTRATTRDCPYICEIIYLKNYITVFSNVEITEKLNL